MLEWSRTSPILIVTLARPELLDRRTDWGAGKRNFTSIYLEPLPIEAMRELLAGLVPGLPASATEAIIRRADGIPLYAVETVRMLLAQGRLVLEEGVYHVAGDLTDVAVPETLTALISSRLDELDAADRSLVADAAVLGQSFTLAGLSAVSGIEPTALDQRLRGLVRRELLVQQVDPRSAERGQYSFVQALIREVAYNTLAKKDRKVRHLAAARFFESLETDELAGALAGHYLAAHGYAADGPEADALAAQARVALRGAAERAAALGSHTQAIAFLEHALTVSPGAADRADLHERALSSAMRGLSAQVAEKHALGALEARRELGDREAIVDAICNRAEAHFLFGVEVPDDMLATLLAAWEEFADFEQTPQGVRLMLQIARTYGGVQNDDVERLRWLERLLPIAERLGLLLETAKALSSMGTGLFRMRRPQQALITLRGAHEMAVSNDFEEVHRNTRTSLTFYEQFADPGAGLAMAREGLDIAGRIGSSAYGFLMVGNGVSCAIRVGDWNWARALLEEWLATEIAAEFYLELYVDRAVLSALSGGDPTSDIAEAERLLTRANDPQYTSYVHWARAWRGLVSGELATVQTHAAAADQATAYFRPLTQPLAARAALWAGDLQDAQAALDKLTSSPIPGQASALDRLTMGAGIAALEGRRGDAVAGYREAVRGWKQLGCAFDEALTAIDLATVLVPTEREMPEAAAVIEGAREALSRMGGPPFLRRLDEKAPARRIAEATPASSDETVPVTA
jgi:tetratricopeptide (TPR) repeat protein